MDAAGREGAATRWAHDLVAWAIARTAGQEVPIPQAPQAMLPPPDETIEADLKSGRVRTNSRRAELEAFARFVTGETHGLTGFGGIPGHLTQQGYNSARAGPVADRAADRIARGDVRYALLRPSALRPSYIPRPAALRILEGNFYQVEATPDCTVALGAEYDGSLWLWDLRTGAMVARLTHPAREQSGTSALAITPDARWAASGGKDGQLLLWNLAQRSCVAAIPAHESILQSVTLAPDASWAFTAGADGSIRLWSLPLGFGIGASAVSDTKLSCAVATADARLAVVGGADGTIRVLGLPDGRELRRFQGHDGPVGAMAITPDGRRVLTGGQKDGTVRLWDPETGAAFHTFEGQASEGSQADRYVGAVNLTPDGRLGISGGEDTLVRVWDLEAGSCLKTFWSHTDTILSVAIAADGSRAVSSTMCDDPTIRVWDLAGYDAPRGHGYRGNVWGLALSADARVAVTVDQEVRVWDLATGTDRPLQRPKDRHQAVALSPDGHTVVFTDGGRIHLVDGETGEVRQTVGGEDHAERVELSPDGRWVVAGPGLRGTSIMTWDLERNDYRLLFKIPGGYAGTHDLAFSRDGRLVFVRGKAGRWAWRLDTGARVECPDRVLEAAYGTAPGSLPGRGLRFKTEDQVLSLCKEGANRRVAAVDVLSTIFSNAAACSAIAVGDRFGALHVFRAHHSDPGALGAIAVQRYRLDLGRREPEPVFPCPQCAGTFVSPMEILEVARDWCGRLGPSEIPCLDLPDEAFMDPRLRTRCPDCKAELQFEPYIAGEGGTHA